MRLFLLVQESGKWRHAAPLTVCIATNSTVVRLGREYGVAAPANRSLAALVRAMTTNRYDG